MISTSKTQHSNNNWSEYRRLVLAELERLSIAIERLNEANAENERYFGSIKTDFVERLQAVKTMIEKQEKDDISILRDKINELESADSKISSEIKVVKAKAAVISSAAAAAITIVSIVLNIIFKS